MVGVQRDSPLPTTQLVLSLAPGLLEHPNGSKLVARRRPRWRGLDQGSRSQLVQPCVSHRFTVLSLAHRPKIDAVHSNVAECAA